MQLIYREWVNSDAFETVGKIETETPNSQFAQEAAKIFDDKISEQQKLKLLKRIATVKDNGTVEFDIPGDVESRVLGVESQSVRNESR
ncbi:hypothetical protein K7X08_004989 [Anisodus acutangulus]|uniref:Uncharacterized protein n=1 Tax=Anisodus acutangulus TaxID=402998 RepID=A0A9Q1RG32_9SOLA|nr:hypothetical protein K7X08_004989 [Anisodus acutangulus]